MTVCNKIYAKFNHFDKDKDITNELQAKMGNDMKILGSKTLQPNGYLAKVYDKDIRRIFQEKLHFKPTANTLNKKAFCINKIDETIDISELETTIEKALDERIIYASTENKLLIFLTESFKENSLINITIQINKKPFYIRNYDPI